MSTPQSDSVTLIRDALALLTYCRVDDSDPVRFAEAKLWKECRTAEEKERHTLNYGPLPAVDIKDPKRPRLWTLGVRTEVDSSVRVTNS